MTLPLRQSSGRLGGTVRERARVRGKFTTPKTRHSRRTLELGPAARAAVEEQYASSRFTDDNDLVFGHPRLGTPLDPARFGREHMRPAIARAGIRDNFRPWHEAQAGHGSSQVTDHYVSLATTLLAGAAEKAEGRMFGTSWAGNGQEPEPAGRSLDREKP